MPRNLVICCDGTNNSLDSPLTNVAHLGALADIGDISRQLVFYDAGVGVEASPKRRTRLGATFSKWSGSAFGTGLVENVEHAYSHLVEQLRRGRPRLSVRLLARRVHRARDRPVCCTTMACCAASMPADSINIVKAFQNLYPRDGSGFVNGCPPRSSDERFDQARRIRTIFARPCPIHFMGLFDTVSSLGWALGTEVVPQHHDHAQRENPAPCARARRTSRQVPYQSRRSAAPWPTTSSCGSRACIPMSVVATPLPATDCRGSRCAGCSVESR